MQLPRPRPDRIALPAVLLVALLGGGACASAVPASSPSGGGGSPAVGSSPNGGSPSGSGAGTSAAPSGSALRIADLAYLVEQLKAIHPDPFLDEGEAGFMARVARIEAAAPSLTDAGFLVAVMDLMGHRDRDGHSGAWAMAQPSRLLTAWPVWLWDFPDGLRVVAAHDPYSNLVGARVTKVGHLAVADARKAVEPLVPRDNASSLRANLPTYLLLPNVLAELGVLVSDDPGLTLELADGSIRAVTPEPMPIEAWRDWIFARYAGDYPDGLPPDPDGPPHLRHRDMAFWSETLAGPAAIYVGYNVVSSTDGGGRSIADLATSIQVAADARPALPVVVDLRNNGGGDNTTYRPLRTALETLAHDRLGRVALLTGRSTFSAAGNFVTDLKVGPEGAGIRLVGEAPGGGLDMYGDVRVVTLPDSRIVVLISSRHHVRAPGDDRLAIEPDRPAEVSWADYLAGRDPVLAAAVTP
jgi:hypothetical protein